MPASVVHDLDEDKIDSEGFPFIAIAWEAAFSVINAKEQVLGLILPVQAHAVVSLTKLKSKSA